MSSEFEKTFNKHKKLVLEHLNENKPSWGDRFKGAFNALRGKTPEPAKKEEIPFNKKRIKHLKLVLQGIDDYLKKVGYAEAQDLTCDDIKMALVDLATSKKYTSSAKVLPLQAFNALPTEKEKQIFCTQAIDFWQIQHEDGNGSYEGLGDD